ncbi:competence protein CoiA family protein [Streptomyces sp900105245]|uniref:competence protein CoiA family protein n=1 Tax=Streptomyces sp. 900105245 TaxID=3154379 RepID=UPI00333015A1
MYDAFGDTRRVQTAVIGSADSDHPVVLPTEARDLDRFRMQHRYDTFWCGTLLGGCGKELADKRYTDRVCHFAHHPPVRCHRTRNGADSADHLFIKRALDGWLRRQGLQAEAEFHGAPGNGLLGLTYRLPGKGAAISLQLARQHHTAWEQRDASLSQNGTHVEWVFGPDTMLARHMTERRGHTLRVACEDGDLSRHVRVGIEDAQHTIRWFDLSQFRMTVDGIAGPDLVPKRRVPFSPPQPGTRRAEATRTPEPDDATTALEPTYIEVLGHMNRPGKLRRQLNTFHSSYFEARVMSRDMTSMIPACVAIASAVPDVRVGVTYLLLGALPPRRARKGEGGGLEWIVEAKSLESIAGDLGTSLSGQGEQSSVHVPKTSGTTPQSDGAVLASRIQFAQRWKDHNQVRSLCVSGLVELPKLSREDRIRARQTIADAWKWLLRQQPNLADVRRNRLLDELRTAQTKSDPDQLLDVLTICEVLARTGGDRSTVRWEPALASARLRHADLRRRQRGAVDVGQAPGSIVNGRGVYGTHSERLSGVLDTVGDSAMVLSYEEDQAFAALSLNRFTSVGSTRADWHVGEVIERCRTLDGEQLSRMARAYAVTDELVVVFRANLAVPSVALEAELVASHAEAVLECSPEGWIYLTDSGVLIEFREGEGLTAWPVPR